MCVRPYTLFPLSATFRFMHFINELNFKDGSTHLSEMLHVPHAREHLALQK